MEKGLILLSFSEHFLLPEFKGELEAKGAGRQVLVTKDPKEIEPLLEKIEIGIGEVPFALVQRMPNLKWLQLSWAGADFLQNIPALKEKPFMLTSASGMNRQPMAEHLFTMLLSWNRCISIAFEAKKKRQWARPNMSQLTVLGGKSMLIIGYGAIGEAVAKAALGFNMQVTGIRNNISKGSGLDEVKLEEASKLHSLLPQADYVVNILPFTPDTRHFVGAAELALMKKSALYLSIGRGGTTDEAALIEALSAKRIAGALLDVTETEPLPESSPLWDLDNVMITAHYAGIDRNNSRLAMDIALENLRRYNSGQALINLVDKNRGY